MKFDGNSYQTNIITQSIRYHNPGSIASHFTKYCIEKPPPTFLAPNLRHVSKP